MKEAQKKKRSAGGYWGGRCWLNNQRVSASEVPPGRMYGGAEPFETALSRMAIIDIS